MQQLQSVQQGNPGRYMPRFSLQQLTQHDGTRYQL